MNGHQLTQKLELLNPFSDRQIHQIVSPFHDNLGDLVAEKVSVLEQYK